jgi:hypothetical protein
MGQVTNLRVKLLEKTTDKIGNKNRTNVDCHLIHPSAYQVKERFLMMFMSIIVSLMFTTGCYTTNTNTSQIPYKKENTKYINNVAILYSTENPEMFVNIRNDEKFFSLLAMGPAIIPQLLMQVAYHSAKKEDERVFNEMIFDLNIDEVLCKKLNTKLQLCSHLHIVPQESITKNKVVWELLEKENKDIKDYQKIGTELGVDTLIEIKTISYGLRDPGIFSDPYAIIKADIKMTTASGGTVLWQDVIQAQTKIKMDPDDIVTTTYEDAQLLREDLEKVVDIISEDCVERLGFDTNYTYLLDKDYLKDKKNNVDIAKKLDELNDLRYDNLITDKDYNEKKLDLIEKAKNVKKIQHANTQINVVNNENGQVGVEEKNEPKLPTLPRRD